MADNFNLRSFLTENKLTKNAKLLKEEQEDYKYFDEEGNGGFYLGTVDGHKIYSMEDSSVMDTCFYAIIDPDGNEEFVGIDVAGEPISSEELQNEYELQSNIADFIEADINAELGDGLDENKIDEGSDYGYEAVVDAIADHFEEGTPEYDQVLAAVEDAFHSNEVDTSDFSHDPSAPGQVVLDIAAGLGLAEVKKKPVMENLTAKERRLVEMVHNALGTEGYGDDNVNLQRKKQGLPPAQGPKYSEGISEEEMVQENPLPKYNSIEELMKEIEHGTNEAAHTYKMNRMKEVAEMLEAKVGSLEEGEHAEHIDQKAVKQMRKDIAALRKAEEKLRKEFDKKFNKKEKAAAAPKAEKVEALQEGTFDLRKFLAENKITSNSRLLKEDRMQAMDIPRKYTEAIVDAKNALNLLRDVVMAGTLMDREMEETFQFTVTLLDMLEEKIQGRRERF